MKMKLSVAVCTASLFIALPLFAQGQSGQPHGNNSDHSGHDNDGKSAAHRQDAPHGFGGNVVLSTPAQAAAVGGVLTTVRSQLASASFRASAGPAIPAAAQSNLNSVIESDDAKSPAATALAAKLFTAGPKASRIVPDLLKGFSALRTDPAVLPSVVSRFNDFTNVASPGFITSPPSEFLAMRAVLAQLTAAAASAK
ncbi:MAG: hypothetical protein ACJ8AK_10705 [Gemmatimonadaceae bacterium]